MNTLTAEEMYNYEKSIMEDKGVPAIVLMESASRAIVRQMKKEVIKKDKILILAGGGNNGGDGIAVGRILHNEGFNVSILVIGNPNHYSDQNQIQQKIAESYGLIIQTDVDLINFERYSVFVDGLFGIGLSRPVEGLARQAIQKVNETSSKRVYAIDIPSGVSAVEGRAYETAIYADETITFGFYKYGMEKEEVQKFFGGITVDDIGFFF